MPVEDSYVQGKVQSVTRTTMKNVKLLHLGIEVDGKEIILVQNKDIGE
jgi:hypothetical protein